MRDSVILAAVLLTLASCARERSNDVCVPVLPGWTTPRTGQPPFFVPNVVRVSGNQIRWNGVQVSEQTLAAYLQESAQLNPMPFVIFDPQTRDCAFASQVRDIVDANYPCRDGACGQGTAEGFKNAPYRTTNGPPA
jgi:hypothetical protein